MDTERKHHPFSPSTLQNLEACPCYASTTSDNERSVAGTLAHSVAESGVDDNRLGDEDSAAVAECLDFVEQRRKLFEAERLGCVSDQCKELAILADGKHHPDEYAAGVDRDTPKVLEIKEAYLPIDDLEFFPHGAGDPKLPMPEMVLGTTAGYIDHGFISFDRRRAEIYDWKFGFWPVEDADNNLQGLAYILGLFHKYSTVDRVRFYFKQPHLDAISDVEVLRADIPRIYLRIQTVVARAKAARAKGDYTDATPRIPACNFCKNLGTCPAVAQFAITIGRKFAPLQVPENITPTSLLNDHDTTLGLRLAQVMEVWARAFKGQTTDRILRGAAAVPTGYTLQSRSGRDVVNVDTFFRIALKYVSADEYTSLSEPPGFTKLKKVIKDRAPRGQKEGAVKEFAEDLIESGAVVRTAPYTFLRAEAPKKTETKNKTNE
jgi:hypothetical protein